MSGVTSSPPITAFLSALDYAREGIDRGMQSYAQAAREVAATGAGTAESAVAAVGTAPPVEPMVRAIEARLQVAAAAKVLAASERTLGALLDVRA